MRYHTPTRSAEPPDHHVLVFDGECSFCTLSGVLVRRFAREPLELLPFQEIGGRGLLTELEAHEVPASAHYITPDGIEYHGGESMTRAFRLVPGGRAAGVLDLPLLAPARDAGYAAISGSRHLVSPVIARLWPGWKRS
jgi:predicted DCC family thiol-disulfide oxidoreductase YuxK